MASSPSFSNARQRLNEVCLPPQDTRICLSVYSRPFSLRNLATIAFLSDGVPPAAVYLVKPLFIAAIAASLMNCGVSKSGSPAPIGITSLPSDLSFAAFAGTARVGEGLMGLRRSATNDMGEAPEAGKGKAQAYF